MENEPRANLTEFIIYCNSDCPDQKSPWTQLFIILFYAHGDFWSGQSELQHIIIQIRPN